MYRMGKEELDAVARVIESKNTFRSMTTGEVHSFECEWKEKTGSKHALLLSGGTDALIAGLVGLGVQPGDEVIVPAYTFMATALAPLAVGAIPVIVDVDETMTLDVKAFEKSISKYTKAVIPVHINGVPSNMDAIKAICDKRGIKILEDSCQADGGSYKGRKLGTIGDAGAYSFNHFKIISAGDGGLVATDDLKVYERALIYHDGGSAFRPYAKDLTEPVFAGFQFRASEFTGAILRAQLQRLDGILDDLRRIKKTILSNLKTGGVFYPSPSNDPEGDCGTSLTLVFEDTDLAHRASRRVGDGSFVLFDSGKHVYCNWTPVIERRGAHCDAFNPFLMEQNRGLNMDTCRVDSCPRSLDILQRTVKVPLHCDFTEAQIQNIIDKLNSF